MLLLWYDSLHEQCDGTGLKEIIHYTTLSFNVFGVFLLLSQFSDAMSVKSRFAFYFHYVSFGFQYNGNIKTTQNCQNMTQVLRYLQLGYK